MILPVPTLKESLVIVRRNAVILLPYANARKNPRKNPRKNARKTRKNPIKYVKKIAKKSPRNSNGNPMI